MASNSHWGVKTTAGEPWTTATGKLEVQATNFLLNRFKVFITHKQTERCGSFKCLRFEVESWSTCHNKNRLKWRWHQVVSPQRKKWQESHTNYLKIIQLYHMFGSKQMATNDLEIQQLPQAMEQSWQTNQRCQEERCRQSWYKMSRQRAFVIHRSWYMLFSLL